MSWEKRRYLETLDPALFRLRYILDPFFLFSRFKNIRSLRELRERFLNLFLYARVRLYPALKTRLSDRATDAKLTLTWGRLRLEKILSLKNPIFPAPAPPDKTPPGAVHLSWNIHIACNYDCTYCFFHGKWKSFVKDNRYLPAEDWIRHWKRFNDRHGPAKIDIAGGEPFTYPGFLDILADIAKRNTVLISTNLSWDIAAFASRIPPGRVEIAASFHPEYADNRPAFLAKIEALHQAGFNASVSMVAFPPLLDQLPRHAAAFMRRGIWVGVQPFRGEIAGRVYPESYTKKSKAALDWMIRGGLADRFLTPRNPPAPQPSEEALDLTPLVLEYQLGRAPTLGKPCNAGVLYGRLQSNGDVTRCAQGVKVGNFFDDNFSFWKKPRPCPFQKCDCINEIIYIQGGPKGPNFANLDSQ